MPKETFFNLPIKKQQRILDAAVREFANKDYQRASIQSIAKEAEVAKGSMYQYFESKKELFFYIIEMASKMKIKILTRLINENPNLPFFDLMEKSILASLQYAQEYPELFQIYQNLQKGLSKDIRKELEERISYLGQMQNKALLKESFEKGEIRKDVSLDLATFIVFNLLKNFGDYLLDYGLYHQQQQLKEYVQQFIKVMKNGLNA